MIELTLFILIILWVILSYVFRKFRFFTVAYYIVMMAGLSIWYYLAYSEHTSESNTITYNLEPVICKNEQGQEVKVVVVGNKSYIVNSNITVKEHKEGTFYLQYMPKTVKVDQCTSQKDINQ